MNDDQTAAEIDHDAAGCRGPMEQFVQQASKLVDGETLLKLLPLVRQFANRRSAAAPGEHVHGAWCHPSADGCPDRPGM